MSTWPAPPATGQIPKMIHSGCALEIGVEHLTLKRPTAAIRVARVP